MRLQAINNQGLVFHLESVCEDRDATVISLPIRGKQIEVKLPLQDVMHRWRQWTNGALIQRAFPELNANEREFLMTGISPEEWDMIMSQIPDEWSDILE